MQTLRVCVRQRASPSGLPLGGGVAIYHLSVKTISRSAGRSATAAAAYRAGVKIVDERTGEIHDYSRKRGVESAELILPSGAPEWAADRGALWNAAEQAETRKNSTVAREFEVALPAELSPAERQRLAHDFARELVKRHGCAADVAIHAPGKDGDERNHHAHILLTTRRLGPDGFTEKTRELDDQKTGFVTAWRARWAEMVNAALERHGFAARVDHRSLEAQGIDREPTRHLGPAATGYERRTKEPSRKRLDFEAEIAERLLRAKEAGELGRREKDIERSIIELNTDLQAALRERERQRQAEQERQRQQAIDPAAALAEWLAQPPVEGRYEQSFDRWGIAEAAAEAMRHGLPPGALMSDEERAAMRSAGWLDSRDDATPKGMAVLRHVQMLGQQRAAAERQRQEAEQKAAQERQRQAEQARQQARAERERQEAEQKAAQEREAQEWQKRYDRLLERDATLKELGWENHYGSFEKTFDFSGGRSEQVFLSVGFNHAKLRNAGREERVDVSDDLSGREIARLIDKQAMEMAAKAAGVTVQQAVQAREQTPTPPPPAETSNRPAPAPQRENTTPPIVQRSDPPTYKLAEWWNRKGREERGAWLDLAEQHRGERSRDAAWHTMRDYADAGMTIPKTIKAARALDERQPKRQRDRGMGR